MVAGVGVVHGDRAGEGDGAADGDVAGPDRPGGAEGDGARGGGLVPVADRVVGQAGAVDGHGDAVVGGLPGVGQRGGVVHHAAGSGGGDIRGGVDDQLRDRHRAGAAGISPPGGAVAAGGGRGDGVGEELVAGIGVVHGDRIGDGRGLAGVQVPGPGQDRAGVADRAGAGGSGVVAVGRVVEHPGQGVGHDSAGVGGLAGVGDRDRVGHLLPGYGAGRRSGLDDGQGRGEHRDGEGTARVSRAGRAGAAGRGGGDRVDHQLAAGIGIAHRHRVGDRHGSADRQVPGPRQDGAGVADGAGAGGGVVVVGGVTQDPGQRVGDGGAGIRGVAGVGDGDRIGDGGARNRGGGVRGLGDGQGGDQDTDGGGAGGSVPPAGQLFPSAAESTVRVRVLSLSVSGGMTVTE